MARYSVNNYTVETLLASIKAGSVAIPEMQRPFVWDGSKVRDLIDSLYKGFPVGYIIVWQNPDVKLKDGTVSVGKQVLIDGQQRITAMAAAIVGNEVLDDHYKWKRIAIAFNPLEEKFEVSNNAIRNSSKWIPDIAPVLEPAFDTFSFVMEYCQKNEIPEQMSQINAIVNKLRGIQNNSLGVITLANDLDIDSVTEIFIRINSKGVVLSQADFAMSKISSNETFGGNITRKTIYNLNIPRYIDSTVPEDQQDIEAHLHGGIPAADVDSMAKYWDLFPGLKARLFSVLREGYYTLNIPKEDIRGCIYNDEEFSTYAERIDLAFDAWKEQVDEGLRSIDGDVDVKRYIVELAELLIAQFADLELVDKYDVYEVLLSYWQETMSDDVFVLKYYGYEAGREWENIIEVTENKKGERKEKIKGWEGKLIPKALVEQMFFAKERKAIDEAQAVVEETQSRLDELTEEQTGDDGYLKDYLNDKDKVEAKQVAARMKELKKAKVDSEEAEVLAAWLELADRLKKQSKLVKELSAALEAALQAKYADLSDEEIKELLVNRKWYYSLFAGIKALYVTASHSMANRITQLAERYENTLPQLEQEVADYEAKVRAHLERMGLAW